MAFTFTDKSVTADGHVFDLASSTITKDGLVVADASAAKKAFEKEFAEFTKGGKFDEKQLATLKGLAETHGVEGVKESFGAASAIEALVKDRKAALTEREIETLTAQYIANPSALNLVNKEATEFLNHAEHGPLKAIKATEGRVGKLNTALNDLHAAHDYSEAAWKGKLQEHGADIAKYADKKHVAQFNHNNAVKFDKLSETVHTELAEFKGAVNGKLGQIATLHKSKAKAELIEGDIKSLKTFVDSRPEYKGHLGDIIGTHPEQAALEKVDGLKGLADEVKKASVLTGEAGKTRGFISKLLTKEGELAKGAKGIWSNRTVTGKVALVGIPLVGAAYIAGVGRNPEKGKYAEQVTAQQQNPQQGLAVG